jgi:hypothetical protein
MFEQSIESTAAFTRPVHSIFRTYNGKQITAGSATLFFVNGEGYAVTCRHVVEMLLSSDKINQAFIEFKKERDQLPRDGKFSQRLKGLEMKYKYSPETVVQVKNTFVGCVDSMSGFTTHIHPKYDLAILKFNDYKTVLYEGHAVFLKNTASIKPGKFLCRLGFPFPEFTNFGYNEAADDIEWTGTGIAGSPRFPIEGMVTRFLMEENKLHGIELSTPGLKGQSGGPLFDEKGWIYGMQSSTKHLHLGFDLVDKEIMVDNKLKKISDYSFIHLGQCIHADIIREFLKEMNVLFYETA